MEDSLLIVGNGEGVLEKQNGKVIDSFDTVVRLGRYVTEGYEKYVGKKTDIISTIFWKLDLDRLKKSKVILSVPINLQESFKESELYISNEYKDYKDNIIYVNNESDIKGLKKMYTDILPPFEGIEEVNFSLGYKTIYFLRKLYPDKKIYTTGFDFFKTSWYWKKDHNRDDSNMHPYIWERLWYSKMKKIGEINEI